MASIPSRPPLVDGTTQRALVIRRVGVGIALSIGFVTSLMAADVWESKPFHTWTDKELAKVLTDSPWAGKGTISYVQNRSGQPPVRETALVTWASARVMREALVRDAFGVTATVPDEAASVLASTPPLYTVTLKLADSITSADRALYASEMQLDTFLVVRGKPPIPATHAAGQVLDFNGRPTEAPSDGRGREPAGTPAFAANPAQRGGGGAGGGGAGGGAGTGAARGAPPIRGTRGRGNVGELPPTTASLLIFRFPRDPITLDDKEVEFVTKLCSGGPASGASLTPAADQVRPQFGFATSAQRGARGGVPQGRGGGQGARMGDPPPPCNYHVKKTFKLKDMVVRGDLAL